MLRTAPSTTVAMPRPENPCAIRKLLSPPLISGGLNSFLIAQGFSGLGMATVVLGAVLNIILDPVFIFIFHMGVAGAAIATVISQMASCAFVLLSLRSHKMPVRLGWGGFQASVIRRIVTFGFSP